MTDKISDATLSPEGIEAASQEMPKPRRRKRTTAPADAAPAEKVQDPVAEKPQEPAAEKAQEPAAEKAQEQEAAPRKKPGRKPRATAAARADAPSEAASDATGKAPAKTAGKSSEPAPAKEAAPKQSAAEAPSPEPAAADASSQASASAEEASSQTSARKRLGRPRKAAPASGDAAAAAAEPSPEQEPAMPAAAASEQAAPAARPASAEGAKETAPAASEATPSEQRPAQDAQPEAQRRQSRPRQQKRSDDAPRNNGAQQQYRNGAQQGQGKQNNAQRDSAANGHRRQRRQSAPVAPAVSREELEEMKVPELRAKATELGIDAKTMKKDELVDAVYEGMARAEGFINVSGLLDILPEGYGFLRTSGYLPGENDIYVGQNTIRRNALRRGDMIAGQSRPARDNEKYPALHRIDSVNGVSPAEARDRVKFIDLTPVYPDERLVMEHGKDSITGRAIDLLAPIGKGQRGLIDSPPKAGKTTILKDIASSIAANNPDVHLMCLLVDERPEEVTDMQRSIKGEVIASTFDMPCENHIAAAELVIERAKRLVEMGEDVVILLDSITRLARAYNLAQPASGRILSGGVDSTALYPPKKFLGAARNIENGGSLTIIGTALIDTGSKMDEVIFEEFKGTGNMELKLDRNLSDRRIFPAIDCVASGTRKEELLLDPQEAPFIWGVRRILANMNNTERATDMLVKSLRQTENNQEFLIRTAKKAQNQREVMEL